MKNKNVGTLIVGIAILILIIIFIFNQAMTQIVNTTCSHGPSCTMYSTIKTQTWFSIVLAGLVLLIGLFFIFSKENERVVIRQIRPLGKIEPRKFDKKSLEGLNDDETNVMNMLLGNKGNMFQSEIVDKTGFNKVKITRILDSLESQGFIERKRRGMTNIVMIKNSR
jgi:uncharacterized membrane protein